MVRLIDCLWIPFLGTPWQRAMGQLGCRKPGTPALPRPMLFRYWPEHRHHHPCPAQEYCGADTDLSAERGPR